MTASFVLGVEATGAGTHAVVVHGGEVVWRSDEAPLNVLLDASAFGRLVEIVKESGATVAGLGVAGLQSKREAALLEMRLRASTGIPSVVGDDAEIAQMGAFGGGPGIVVIEMGGSNCFGRDASGRSARAGGYGHVIGDEGSSFWIAAQALRRALRSSDGRAPKSPALERAVASAYGVDLTSVVRRITEHASDPGFISRFARTVMAVNDPAMHEILDEAVAHLVAHVTALRSRLGHLPVAMHGSVFEHAYFRQRFVAATDAVDSAADPVFGAVVLASRPTADRDMGFKNSEHSSS